MIRMETSLLAAVLMAPTLASCDSSPDRTPSAAVDTKPREPVDKNVFTDETMKELSTLTDDIVKTVKDASDKKAGVAEAQKTLDARTGELAPKMQEVMELRGFEIRKETQDNVAKVLVDVTTKMAQMEIDLLTATMNDKTLETALEKLTTDHERLVIGNHASAASPEVEPRARGWSPLWKDDSVNQTMTELSTLTDDIVKTIADASDKKAGVAKAQQTLDAKKSELAPKMKELMELRGFQLSEEAQSNVAKVLVDVTTQMAQMEIDLLTATMSDKDLETALGKLTTDHENLVQGK
jgi:electron transfer flavoprotein alpha subunit